MILLNCNSFPREGRILGIDWGLRRTGVAISDETRNFIFIRPPIISNRKGENLAKKIADLAKGESVVGIVIGLPLRSDGSQSEQTKAVHSFAENLCCYTNLPILLMEENLTSFIAQRELGKARVREIKQRLDSESARLILENAIAVLRRNK